jgi:hypothetical protein
MAPDTDEPFGIRVLKWLCLFACLSALADLALSPVFAAIFTAFRLRDALPENHTQRAISIVIGLSYAPLYYGIRRRLAGAWKLGWLLLIASFSEELVQALTFLKQTPQSGGWAAYAVVTIGFFVVVIYWSLWWNRQKYYFSRHRL